MVTTNFWETVPGICGEIPTLTAYIPENKKSVPSQQKWTQKSYKKRNES